MLTLLALVVAMTTLERSWLRGAVSRSAMYNRLAHALVLAAATGVLGALPFAIASSPNSRVTFLAYVAIYGAVIALGALAFAVMVARIATGQIEFGDGGSDEPSLFGSAPLHRTNPATGLPMNGSIDIAGNAFGSDFHSPHSRMQPE